MTEEKMPSMETGAGIKQRFGRFSFSPERKRKLLIAAGAAGLLFVAWFAWDGFTHEETDDAYVTGHLHNVAARIAGVVTEVRVEDNQKVKEGEVLVRLDAAENEAQMALARADEERAKADFERNEALLAANAVSKQEWEQAKDALATAEARLAVASLQVSYATISAPASGRVGRKNVEVGNRVQAGQTLLTVIEPDLWVVANFKETQLAGMRAGEKVSVRIDAIPGKVFRGTIDSFSPASGNEFALLPADNATGNFTKIVQRVPVKIRFEADALKEVPELAERLRAGLSAVVKVRL